MKAFCWRNGVIGFGRSTPPGALQIADGPEEFLRLAVTGCARLAYDNATWLVPGIPEAEDNDAAFDAFIVFRRLITRRLKLALRFEQEDAHGA